MNIEDATIFFNNQLWYSNLNFNPKKDKIGRLTEIAFQANNLHFVKSKSNSFHYWDEKYYLLEKTSIWKTLTQLQKNQLLNSLSSHYIDESFFIENLGVFYAQKMSLLSKSLEERSFYSIMGLEETRHLYSLMPFYSDNILNKTPPSFAQFIAQIITDGDRDSLLFFIQIILEGWGISYYQNMAAFCLNPDLKQTLINIVNDETRHHSGGMILINADNLHLNSFFEDTWSALIDIVRIGPFILVNELMKVHSGLTKRQIEFFLQEIDAESLTQTKINLLHQIASKALPEKILNRFSGQFWKSHSHSQMSDFLMANCF